MNLYGLVTILKLNVGRGYVIHNHDSVRDEGGHRAARAAKKQNKLTQKLTLIDAIALL